MKSLHASIAHSLSTKTTFGPLWTGESSQPYVMQCLRKYIRDEGHGGLFGKSVLDAAHTFIADHYAASGEELDALACLLINGKGAEVI